MEGKLTYGKSGCLRPAICVGRRRSNAMAKCPSARIVSTTRPIVYSPRLKRNGIRQKGTSRRTDGWLCSDGADARDLPSAKYIEGLENRLGRMESLLRLSGLLSQDDGGKTDLGTLEKRLADRSFANEMNNAHPSPSQNQSRTHVPSISTIQTQPNTASQSHQPTPQGESHSMSPRTAATSPISQKESETEVEALSDMMCSLVTNNCGETRYIGKFLLLAHPRYWCRLIVL